jgi:hypothetical protein
VMVRVSWAKSGREKTMSNEPRTMSFFMTSSLLYHLSLQLQRFRVSCLAKPYNRV